MREATRRPVRWFKGPLAVPAQPHDALFRALPESPHPADRLVREANHRHSSRYGSKSKSRGAIHHGGAQADQIPHIEMPKQPFAVALVVDRG